MFFFNDTATPEIYTLSLHDALPISRLFSSTPACVEFWITPPVQPPGLPLWQLPLPLPVRNRRPPAFAELFTRTPLVAPLEDTDRKSTRLNSSHANISYAVFCLKKKP